ncbi:MAG: HAMP domain-containing histidine kinase [Phycisphaerales bacterium]|nr:HAMP domain-containing histidine kinase [Phycisphaerales bacterium]
MFRGISLANKCLLLFGGAVAAIVLAALMFPFFRMNSLVDEGQLENSRQMVDHWEQAERQIKAAVIALGGTNVITSRPPQPQRYVFGDEEPKPGTEGYAGVPAVRVGLVDAQKLAESDRFVARALEALAKDAKRADFQQARWKGTKREYRYAKAVRADVEGKQEVIGLVLLDRETGEPLRLLLINTAYLFSAGLFVSAFAVLVFYLITHHLILGPVRTLKETAESVRQGDLRIRSEISTGDEFEELAETFNHMLGDLEGQQAQLRAINAAMNLKLDEITASNSALYEAAKLKGDFLANVSHELRTPLNSIIGFADLLLEIARTELAAGDDSTRLAKRVRFLENILNAARDLLEMINGLLEMAKIEAGKYELRIEKVSVQETCEALAGLIFPLASVKGIKVNLEIAGDLPLIETDAKKFRQIVFNFLSNAVKFSPTAEEAGARAVVTLRAERLMGARPGEEPSAAESDRVRISVIDNGPGIAVEDQGKIFEKFSQLSRGHTREHAGTGLGLTICKELAGVLQGELQLVSDLGRGAMFSLMVPVTLDTNRLRESEAEAKFRGALKRATAVG